MKHFVRGLSLAPIITLFSLFFATPALALPPFPSSFYGTVKVNGANVSNGTVIEAVIAGQVYAKGYAQTYQGSSFFSLDVAGDDTSTTALDGGREGDTLQFKIGGLLADQTAVWHGGTNVVLNLTTTSSKPISKPQAIPTPVPTQTEMVMLIQPSSIPSTDLQSVSSIPPAPASPIATEPSPSLHVVATDMQVSQAHTSTQNGKANRSGNISPATIVVIALPIMTVIGYSFWALYKKKM